MKKLALLLALFLALTPVAQAETQTDAASTFINNLLSTQAAAATDPWAAPILASGAQSVKLEGSTLTFSLRPYDPNLKQLDVAATDYARQLAKNLSAYSLQCTLQTTGESGSLAASDAEVKSLMKTVAKAAKTAKKAFGSKAMCAALMDVLASDTMTLAVAGEYGPLFATQGKAKLDVSGGPHALSLSAVFAAVDTLLGQGYDAARSRLAKQGGASALTSQQLETVLIEELTAQAAALRKKAGEQQVFTLDIDALLAESNPTAGDAYVAFLASYREPYYTTLSTLEQDAAAMPDEPALDFPGSGWISGSTTGTKVIFKAPKDGYARFVQMRSVDTDAAVVSGFIQSGQKATLRVPKGMYTILVAIGEMWYGEGKLFGSSGSYIRSEQIEILGSSYYHTITLGGVTDGNMSTYGADPSEFQ